MPFGSRYRNSSASSGGGSSTSKESAFLSFSEGHRIIRILTEEIFYWRYYMNVTVNGARVQRPVIVGSYDNPIRDYMNSLDENHPDFRRVAKRFATNVLDRTIVKVGSSGNTIYPSQTGKFPDKDPTNGEDISNIEPRRVDKVKILELGPDLMSKLEPIATLTRDRDTGEFLSIHDFDVRVIVSGQGRNQKKQPMAESGKDPVGVENVYDLEAIFRPLPNDVLEKIIQPGSDYLEVLKEAGFLHNYPMIPYNPPEIKTEEESLF